MASFTTFSEQALERYLIMFDRGALVSFEPAAGGIENSNYFVELLHAGQSNHYVLTIVEDLSYNEVPFFNKLLLQLHYYGLPVPVPQATLDGMTCTSFSGKPAVLFNRLPGVHLAKADETQCYAIGRFLAESHQVLASLDDHRENPYPPSWMQATLESCSERLSKDESDILKELAGRYVSLLQYDLPVGLIHGDLFLDNALFESGSLSGVIDFYHACHDFLIQDLAITLNDWCLDGKGQPDQSLELALLQGYESFRGLTARERQALPDLRKVSAARFALTRLLSGDPPLKNPAEMLDLLNRLV